MSGEISFTTEALAHIYLGKITKWNDWLLRTGNPGLRLRTWTSWSSIEPTAAARATRGASTSQISPEWRARAGSRFNPRWLTGRAAAANEGVTKLVKEMAGSIGYVEFIYAPGKPRQLGRIRNRHGEFISASLESITAATRGPAGRSNDFKISILNPPGGDLHLFVVPASILNAARRTTIVNFRKWDARSRSEASSGSGPTRR